jgi:hypothetical protein
MPILDAAVKILCEMATFESAGVSQTTNVERRTMNAERQTVNAERRTLNAEPVNAKR